MYNDQNRVRAADGSEVNRGKLLRQIYSEVNEFNSKRMWKTIPAEIKDCLRLAAKNDLWELCFFISSETTMKITKQLFDELEKRAWTEHKTRSKFYFSLLKLADDSGVDLTAHVGAGKSVSAAVLEMELAAIGGNLTMPSFDS